MLKVLCPLVLSVFLTASSFAGLADKSAKTLTPAPSTAIDPIADPKAVVQVDHARFTVLAPELIRMEWAADDKFEDHASFVFLNRRLPVPPFSKSAANGNVTIDTGKLKLSYSGSEADTGFTAQNLSIEFTVDGKKTTWHPGDAPTGNLMGTTRTLDGAKGAENLREPIGPGLVSRDGWAVVDDSGPLFSSANFDMQRNTVATQPWVLERPAGKRQDLYFFGYGHDYRAALSDYVKVAGRIPLPPRFAFGAWWSRYWAYSDQELRDLVTGFHQNNVPYDVFVIDMDWHKTFGRNFAVDDASGHRKGWSGYSWDNDLFPDPKDFLTELHNEGLKVTLNLHPASGVQPWEDAYPQFAKNMGIDPATQKYVPFDLTDRKFAENYMNLLHHPLEAQGVDFWWLDWQQEGDTKVAGVNPTWWLNYMHFTDQEREGKRPLLFHRWGGLGNHRYQIGFSGDTVSVWDSLAFQPGFTAQAANVGYAYWSHDIGGHMPGAVDPEILTRWIQFGIYSPILRTHTTKNAEAERRIWAYPEPYSGLMREAFQQRYAMEPYLYTEARRTFDTGVAFLRPLYYDSPRAADAYTHNGEYLFGDSMLVAPVTKPSNNPAHHAVESVWLPEGDWIEQPTGTVFHGPSSQDRNYAIDQIPVFVKAGAIVPNQPSMSYTGQKPVDPLILNVYPLADAQASRYTLYEDNGHAEDYQKNVGTAWTDISATQHGDELTVTVAPVRGGYPGMAQRRGYELRLPFDWPPASVTANGVSLNFTLDARAPGWRYEGNTLTTVIPVTAADVHRPTTIVVRRSAGSLVARKELQGFPDTMHRAREAYDQLSADFPGTRAVPDAVIRLMQTGNRIGYHPETARPEIERMRASGQKDAMTALQDLMQAPLTPGRVGGAPPPSVVERERKHKERVGVALAVFENAY